MTKKNQIIFMDGKEEALKSLFGSGSNSAFPYLAIGYNPSQDNGFEDFSASEEEGAQATYGVYGNGFFELEETNGYTSRILLEDYPTDSVNKDESTGKVLKKFQATLNEDVLATATNINQIAIVNTATVGDVANTKFYSATTFKTFAKSSESTITFVIGFRL